MPLLIHAYMKRALLTIVLALGFFGVQAQATWLLGEKSRVITAYLGLNKVKYRAVYDSCGYTQIIVRDVDGGTAVYYFKDDEVREYSFVKYDARAATFRLRFDMTYKRYGNTWWDDAENAYITVAEANGTVFVNAVRVAY